MAGKARSVGYIATSKKDPSKYNLCLTDQDGVKHYFFLSEKPSEEQVEANPKLAKIAETWPEWKLYDVLKFDNEG